LARGLGIPMIRHDRYRGYGGNQKTCYTAALARGADIVVMLHPGDHRITFARRESSYPPFSSTIS
jgi:hypothetical protein